MKTIFSKTIAIVMCLVLLFGTTVFASNEAPSSADVNLLDMDFGEYSLGTSHGFDGFAGYSNGTATVVETVNSDGVVQNALCLTDRKSENRGVVVTKNLPEKVNSGIIEMEVKFKEEKRTDDFLSFGIYLRSGQKKVNDFFVNADDGYICIGNGKKENIRTLNDFEQIAMDIWYTLTIWIDLDKDVLQTKLVAHYSTANLISHRPADEITYIDNFPLHRDYKSGDGISNIYIETLANDGKLLFDYIRLTKKAPGFEIPDLAVKPLPLPYVSTPGQKPVDNATNVMFNGKYMYFAKAPVVADGHIMVPVRSAIKALGFKPSYENGNFVGIKDKEHIVITPGSDTVVYNGLNKKLTKPVTNDRIEIVSLTELAEIIGASVTFDSANDVYIITKEEAK